jgi:methylase of polypeptide subunit release factors
VRVPASDVSLSDDEVVRLRTALEGYTVDAVVAAIGDEGQASLGRNHTLAAQRALGRRDDPLATLTRLFILQAAVSDAAVRRALPVDLLAAAGVLRRDGDEWHARVDIRPYASPDDGADGWLVSDHAATLDTARGAPRPDHVLGVSPASTTLAQLTIRTPVERALDLGTGCGVQALHLAKHARNVVATDLNPRALRLADLGLRLSGVDAELRLGSLYDAAGPDLYDLIVTNPPFVMSPPSSSQLTYRESDFRADGLMRAVVRRGADHLSPGGVLQVLGNWAHVAGQPWQERLESWVAGTGCDALVIQREVLDPYEYIEIWLADAGLAGTPGYLSAYETWLDYFDQLDIIGIGMGWVTLVNAGRDTPEVRVEEWTHAVEQPVGAALAAQLGSVDAARWNDERVLNHAWLLTSDVVQETIGAPGAEDPAHIVLRQQRGLRRAVEVDTALGGVLGACDGELTLREIIAAVAQLLDVPAGDLIAQVLPPFRRLIADAWFAQD